MIRTKKPQEIAESSVTHASCPQSQHTTKICLDFIFQEATAILRKDRKFITVDWLSLRVPDVSQNSCTSCNILAHGKVN